MRPRSITGPLILVALGTIFLINNIWRDIPVWRIFVDYWPVVLIVIGLIGLVEVLYHVSRGTQVPPKPIAGGGLVWLLVLIMFAVWGGARNGIHIGRLDAGGVTILGTDYTFDVSAADPAAGIRRVVFDNVRGNVVIKGEANGSGIHVAGRKTIRAFSNTDAERANRESQLRIERQGDLLIVHADEPASQRMLNISADLDVTLPKSVDVETRGRAGDVTVDDLDGSVDVGSGRGDIRLGNIGRNVRVDGARHGLIRVAGVKGDVDLQGNGGELQVEFVQGQVTVNGDFNGTLEFQALSKPLHFQSSRSDLRVIAVPGHITLDSGSATLDNLTGPVRFDTRDRDVRISNVSDSLDLRVERADVQVTQQAIPLPKIDISVRRSGQITLTLPEKAAFSIDGRTSHGEVRNDFGAELHNESDGREATVKGRMGAGPAITLFTERGDITLRKN